MILRSLTFILAVAGIQATLFLRCIHTYLNACSEVDYSVSVGLGDFTVAPVFHIAWLVLSVPFGLLTLLLPRTYTVHALHLRFVIPDALLWGWCAHRLYFFVRRPGSRTPAPNNALQRTEAGGGACSVFRPLRRQPASLSLSSLDASSRLL